MKRAADIAASIVVFAFAMVATIKPDDRLADPKPDERIEILKVRPIPLNVTTPNRFMLLDQN